MKDIITIFAIVIMIVDGCTTDEDGDRYCPGHSCGTNCCYDCYKTVMSEPQRNYDSQNGVYITYSDRLIINESLEILVDYYPLTMKIGGYVFEDGVMDDKESTIDEVLGQNDIRLANIEVALYDATTGQLATFATLKEEDPDATTAQINDENDYMRRINPTLTDENGYYEFRGVSPEKKYYVKFTYNGQIYIPTTYSTDETKWSVTSKGTELNQERTDFDDSFEEIRSAPNNYQTSNSLQMVGTYNQTFNLYELCGYTLQDGKYTYNASDQLIDSYYVVDSQGNLQEGDQLQDGIISKKIKEFIRTYHQYPDINQLRTIYSDIAGGDIDIWRRLQFIEDCKMHSYTKPQDASDTTSYDQYPLYDEFTTYVATGNKYPNNSYSNGTYSANASTYQDHTLLANGTNTGGNKGTINYKNVYPGQLQIHQGLVRRPKFDAALRKDVYKLAIKINDKTEVYNYDKRQDDDSFWDIQVRLQNYDTYYGGKYQREVYPSDYNFQTTLFTTQGGELEAYVTYKITIRNQSQGIMANITEVVDYYDDDYEYVESLSWVMYQTNNYSSVQSKQEIAVPEKSYYNAINSGTVNGNIEYARDINSTVGVSPRYPDSPKDIQGSTVNGTTYQAVYISGLQNKNLATGEQAYIYLTFRVREENEKIILDEPPSDPGKQNIAEINGYRTYYQDDTELPNNIQKNAGDAAGIIDFDSDPGNLRAEDLVGEKYEHNFEDDTDRANGIRIVLDQTAVREVNGMVWEDKRTELVENAMIGDGIYTSGEKIIDGIKVEMFEIIDGEINSEVTQYYDSSTSQWRPASFYTNSTNNDWNYQIKGFIPGEYVIRFSYGGVEHYYYNGQDYKSTIYQKGIDQSGYTDLDEKYTGYTDPESDEQNETAGYGYDIQKTDDADKNNGLRLSDAKDIWSYRLAVNDYCDGNGDGVGYGLAYAIATQTEEAIENTKMIADTGVIVIEVEYNRQHTLGQKQDDNGAQYYENNQNGNYVIDHVDFGLVERPKAGLELNKQITNIRVILSSQNILFDANEATNNLVWEPKTPYDINQYKLDTTYDQNGDKNGAQNIYSDYERYDEFRNKIKDDIARLVKEKGGIIQATIDEEIMHGATIQINYQLIVKNIGEVDYNEKLFYYMGEVKDLDSIVKTSAELVIDYVENNLQFREEDNEGNGWSTITEQEIIDNEYVSDEVVDEILGQYNTIVVGEGLNKRLKPAIFDENNVEIEDEDTYVEVPLLLSQLITPQNERDDLTYDNVAEILKISNDVGRRMAYSIQGNQNPITLEEIEPDAGVAEQVVILPPFGESHMYIILILGILVIISTSIIVIKRLVFGK